MALLDPNKASIKDVANNKRNQQIRFCNVVVLRASNVARKFAIDKN